jgi:hypothetical protein
MLNGRQKSHIFCHDRMAARLIGEWSLGKRNEIYTMARGQLSQVQELKLRPPGMHAH